MLFCAASGLFSVLASLGSSNAQRSHVAEQINFEAHGEHLHGGELLAHAAPGGHHHLRQQRHPRSTLALHQDADVAANTSSLHVSHPGLYQPGCGVPEQTTASSQRGKHCPVSCPLYVQDRNDDLHCSFQCVQASVGACHMLNPYTPVPDLELGFCRACNVDGCRTCYFDGTDTCAECKKWYDLVDGKCVSQYKWRWYAVFTFLAALVICLVVWLVALVRRPIVNAESLERGLTTRSTAKLHMPSEESLHDSRQTWPLSTNLQSTPVAGLGVTHLFNFQFVIIMWAIGVLLAWIVLGFAVDQDFFRLGTRSPGQTPRDCCIIVQWGYTTQNRLRPAKVFFVAVLYVVSFVLALLYGVWQLRHHQRIDAERVSHRDYTAKCVGLPCLAGTVDVETELSEAIQHASGETVLGVSVCWDFSHKEDVLMTIIEDDVEDRLFEHRRRRASSALSSDVDGFSFAPSRRTSSSASPKRNSASTPASAPRGSASTCRSSLESHRRSSAIQEYDQAVQEMGFLNRMLVRWENVLLSPSVQRIVKKGHASSMMAQSSIRRHRASITKEAEPDVEEIEVDVREELEKLYCTEDAFIVFDTESSRNDAIAAVAAGDVKFHGNKICLELAPCEPQAVNWNRMKNESVAVIIFRAFCGLLCIVVALMIWCLGFYGPYASIVLKSDYANGTDSNTLALTMFGFVVIGGNALMYVVCAEVADRIGFKLQRSREVCYMLLYCFSCVFNVLLDLVMAYHITYNRQVGMGMKTHDGKHLSEGGTWKWRFTTYAMQKSLGSILSDYSFPATFLFPYIAEPLVVIIMPYQIMSLIVRTHSSITGQAADAYLASTPMDLSRYADLLLNVMLAVLIFFFPGGYVLYIFGGLIFSHLVIYNYDRLRVLYSIPACDYVSTDVEFMGQLMLSVPCGMLLSCAVFKAHSLESSPLGAKWKDSELVWRCLLLLLMHVIVHSLILIYVVPLFGLRSVELNTDEYKICAQMHACSWFSSNPVHCLRSAYIFHEDPKHDPPCDYYIAGYDYLLRKNPDLHLYYRCKRAVSEDWDTLKHVMSGISHVQSGVLRAKSAFLGTPTEGDCADTDEER